ncbi:hypothetical protein ACFVMC_10925 [Nocardia sp. NPDC127579]|uniref:hypothetical protein n=1 Tax=Nocardia sp. NPDC127579 TaxID=3345402 RepID=UPI00363D2E5B
MSDRDHKSLPPSVRAAQLMSWLYGGVPIALALLAVATESTALSAYAAVFLPGVILALFAFGFTRGKNLLRVAAIYCAGIAILWSLGAVAQGRPAGLLGAAASFAIVVLLNQRTTVAWFARAR